VPTEPADGAPLLIGTTDDRLLIDRVRADAKGFLGYQAADLLGRSILSLVDATNVSTMRGAFGEAFRTDGRVATAVAIRSKLGRLLRCEAVVVALDPGPSSAFILLPAEADGRSLTGRRIVDRLREGAAHTDVDVAGIALLTKRESEIVLRFVSGDRVRAIAARLFLSQSTVRNHLSSVYRKLGVRSQQELVDLFRVTDSPGERD
jgi:DNA-binding CsgD family transcriptional regulator